MSLGDAAPCASPPDGEIPNAASTVLDFSREPFNLRPCSRVAIDLGLRDLAEGHLAGWRPRDGKGVGLEPAVGEALRSTISSARSLSPRPIDAGIGASALMCPTV